MFSWCTSLPVVMKKGTPFSFTFQAGCFRGFVLRLVSVDSQKHVVVLRLEVQALFRVPRRTPGQRQEPETLAQLELLVQEA